MCYPTNPSKQARKEVIVAKMVPPPCVECTGNSLLLHLNVENKPCTVVQATLVRCCWARARCSRTVFLRELARPPLWRRNLAADAAWLYGTALRREINAAGARHMDRALNPHQFARCRLWSRMRRRFALPNGLTSPLASPIQVKERLVPWFWRRTFFSESFIYVRRSRTLFFC